MERRRPGQQHRHRVRDHRCGVASRRSYLLDARTTRRPDLSRLRGPEHRRADCVVARVATDLGAQALLNCLPDRRGHDMNSGSLESLECCGWSYKMELQGPRRMTGEKAA